MADAPSYAIVAIAAQDDYVWRLSSDKKPHLTLLYLGDQLNNLDRVQEFIAQLLAHGRSRCG